MKKYILTSIIAIVLPFSIIAQNITWPVKALQKFGQDLVVNAYFDDGTIVPLTAVMKDNDTHFMDVKVVKDGQNISVKICACDDLLLPVKAVLDDGTMIDLFATDNSGEKYEIKGVSREGNLIVIAAIISDEKQIPLIALSPEGKTWNIYGVKFTLDNVEMEINETKVAAHVKALPALEIEGVESKWTVSAVASNGSHFDLFAITDKGKELPLEALMKGRSAQFMEVKAKSSLDVLVKLIKSDDGTVSLKAIDEFGRVYDVKAKNEMGVMYDVIGGEKTGNVIPVYAVNENGTHIPVKAISSAGHEFDIHGVKAYEKDVEGIISGWDVWIRYYAHVKAMAPIQEMKLEN